VSRFLICSRGHHWQPPAAESYCQEAPQRFCPICGTVLESAASNLEASNQSATDFQAPNPSPLDDAPRTASKAEDLPTAVYPGHCSATAESLRLVIEGYEILGELGRGSMGVVYKVRQTQPNRFAALKMLLPDMPADEKARARFRIEVEAAARLQHPNIVHIYEVGEHQGRPFYSMEYVEGGSLA